MSDETKHKPSLDVRVWSNVTESRLAPLSLDDQRAGILLAVFHSSEPLAPGSYSYLVWQCHSPCTPRRLIVSPLCASSVRVMSLTRGGDPLLPYNGNDGVSGTMFPPLPMHEGDRVAPWTNIRVLPSAPGFAWQLEVVNRGREPIYVDAALVGSFSFDQSPR